MKLQFKLLLISMFTLFLLGCEKDKISNKSGIEIPGKQRYLDQEEFNFEYITPHEASCLTYYVEENCQGTDYEDAITNGIQAWNDLPSPIFFTKVNDAANADLRFTCFDGLECGEAVASLPVPSPLFLSFQRSFPDVQTYFPSGGSIGGLIHLASTWRHCFCTDDEDNCNFTGSLPECFFQRTVMHEIGHCLGLVHNDDLGGTLVPGTTELEQPTLPKAPSNGIPGSIFNDGSYVSSTCNWCTETCEFIDSDIFSIQFLYQDVEILGDEHICIGDIGIFCIDVDSESSISWNVLSSIPTENPNCLALSSNFSLVYNLEATVTSENCTYTVQKDVHVHDDCMFQPFEEMPDKFNELCQGGPGASYYFLDDCIESLNVTSSSSNVNVTSNKRLISVRSLYPTQEVVDITIVPINHCGTAGAPLTWTIMVNNPWFCDGFDEEP